MLRFAFVLITAALLALPLACGEPVEGSPDAGPVLVGEQNCVDGLDNDGDGLVDCDDPDCDVDSACRPPDPIPCGAQNGCGDIFKNDVAKLCLDQKCVPAGLADKRTGEPLTLSVVIGMEFNGQWGAAGDGKPKTAIVRLVYPKTTDGQDITCEALSGTLSGKTQADRTKLEDNPAVNLVYRNLIPLSWQGAETTFRNLPASGIPRGNGYLLYGEAWFGARDGELPTAGRAVTSCVPAPDLESAPDDTSLLLKFPGPGR